MRKDDEKSIFVKYTFEPEKFMEIITQRETRTQGKTPSPTSLYTSKLPISHDKKKDLLCLCKNGIIPSHFHVFRLLPTRKINCHYLTLIIPI